MDFLKQINADKRLIDSALKRYLKKVSHSWLLADNPLLREQWRLLENYCRRDAKRLRPILTLMAYRAVGGKKVQTILEPALAFELFHNYTLVHDDIYDEDQKRRGEWANHVLLQRWFKKKYGCFLAENILFKNETARFGVVGGIINGKFLHALSCWPILDAKIPESQKIDGLKLHQAASLIDNTGQAIDLYFEKEKDISEKDYYDMVLCKTGQLFKSAILWGSILGGATQSQKNALIRYIAEVAIVFQIKDDLLDIDESGGKRRDLGSDIRKGKKTLLVIHALKKASTTQRRAIERVLGDEKASLAEIKKTIELLEQLGSVSFNQQMARQRIAKAIKYLDLAKPAFNPEAKKFFQNLASFMLERKK